jgi:hypothetical protein
MADASALFIPDINIGAILLDIWLNDELKTRLS